jgi:hypothetical protein
MPPPPSPLADTVASLRVATLAIPAHACVPAAIHALILACLARILGRLEEMIRAWHAGQLAPPTRCPGTARTPAMAPRPNSAPFASAPRRRARRAASQARLHMPTERLAPAGRLPVQPPALAPRPERHPPHPGNNAGAAPPPLSHAAIRRRISLVSAAVSHVHFVTIS